MAERVPRASDGIALSPFESMGPHNSSQNLPQPRGSVISMSMKANPVNNRTSARTRCLARFRKGCRVLVLFLCCFYLRPASTLADSVAKVQRELDRILLGHNDPKAKLGARVVDLTTGQVLYEHDAATPMIPASNMKLIVCAAAIDRFGKDYQFKTVLAIRGRDLVVVGCGDPTFGDEKLAQAKGEPITAVFREWADKLSAAGVKQVTGNIVIDDSVFDRQFVHPSWPADQFQAWYEAPIGGLNFNANCIEVSVKPTKKGAACAASFIPGNMLLKLTNSARTGTKHAPVVSRKRGTNVVTVSGTVARSDKLGPLTVQDPGLYFGHVLKTVLASKGIKVLGDVVREKLALGPDRVPTGGHAVAIHAAPLRDAVNRAGTHSLGMMAEGLFKRLGSEESGVGSWETGRSALRAFLVKAGAAEKQFVIDDGSGLSRKNNLSALATTQVLAYMFKAPGGRFEMLRDSLARPGRDGTLHKRMRVQEIKDRIYAKTGYINGVRTLAGYIQTKSGRWLAFAFYYNGTGKTRPLADIQDRACELLVQWPDVPAPQGR